MAGDKLTFAAIVLVAIVAIVGMMGLMSFGGLPTVTGLSTTQAGTAYVNITALLCIDLTDNQIDFANGSVDQDSDYAMVYSTGNSTYNGTWDTVTDYFVLENCGNTWLNVTINISDKDFMGGTGGDSWYNGTDDTAEAGSCNTWDVTENSWQNFAADGTYYLLCGNLSSSDSTDTIRVYLKLKIPSDAPVAKPSATIGFKAVET